MLVPTTNQESKTNTMRRIPLAFSKLLRVLIDLFRSDPLSLCLLFSVTFAICLSLNFLFDFSTILEWFRDSNICFVSCHQGDSSEYSPEFNNSGVIEGSQIATGENSVAIGEIKTNITQLIHNIVELSNNINEKVDFWNIEVEIQQIQNSGNQIIEILNDFDNIVCTLDSSEESPDNSPVDIPPESEPPPTPPHSSDPWDFDNSDKGDREPPGKSHWQKCEGDFPC